MSSLLSIALAYLVGSLPIGLVVGKLVRGIDVRQFGSGNIGASNVWRTLGPRWGVLVFLLDVAKGVLPVVAAHAHGANAWVIVGTGLAAILGHNFSPFLRLQGGKGVATSLGVAFGFCWPAALAAFAAWGVTLAVTRYISVSSLVGVPLGALLIWLLNGQQLPYGLFGLLAAVFVVVKHRSNLARLKAGTEPKVGSKKNPPAAPPANAHPS